MRFFLIKKGANPQVSTFSSISFLVEKLKNERYFKACVERESGVYFT